MLKLIGLLVGLAAVAGMRAAPSAPASGAPSSLEIAAAPPLYAARDVFSALGAPRP